MHCNLSKQTYSDTEITTSAKISRETYGSMKTHALGVLNLIMRL